VGLYRGDVRVTSWIAVVPVKEAKRAKSRLGPELETRRADLAAAFAADTVTALLAARPVDLVVVVGGRGLPEALLDDRRIRTLPDPGGLNAAAADGIAWARRQHPRSGVLILAADLPAATGSAVESLLAAVSTPGRWVLPDVESVGSTGLLMGPDTVVVPDFGEGSLARHRAAGADIVEASGIDGLRRDVDTAAQLAEAVRLGVGSHTRIVLETMPEPWVTGGLR
jgi:2-phospho-L-lactate/phosphoenolpyruvate guanylyltransferase